MSLRFARWAGNGALLFALVGCAAGESAPSTDETGATTTGAGGGGGATTSAGGGGATGTGGDPFACGDGVLDPGEQCDGSALAGKSCVTIGQGFVGGTLACKNSCTYETSGCDKGHACGDGAVDPGEACDTDDLAGNTCLLLGFTGGNLACTDQCQLDDSGCTLCGNDIIEGAEACDGVDLAGNTCATFGHDGGKLACTPDCSGFDESACTDCGNGVLESPEECDPPDLAGKDCTDFGFTGGTLVCAACQFDTGACVSQPTCPNGVIDPGEQCDGQNLGGATCAGLGYTGGQLGCTPGCTYNVSGCTQCGNGALEAGEACDDGNVTSGDGCSATCQVEQCDPDGLYSISSPIFYQCCTYLGFPLVDVTITQFSFFSNGATITSAPDSPTPLSGAPTTCPVGSFSDTGSVAGGCTETYTLTGSFTGPNTWTGTYTIGFTGADCGCFGSSPCTDQVFSVTATK